MGIYIYGAGKIGAKVKERLQEYTLSAEGFIDGFKTGDYVGLPIYGVEIIEKLNNYDNIIISVLNTNSILEIYKLLRERKIKNIYWFYDAVQKKNIHQDYDFFTDQCLDMSSWGNLIMPHIELHISDKCNLDCRGCSHFSPLFDELNADFNQKINDIRQIKALFDDVFRIDILGGEPLLNPEVGKYVSELRKELPKTFIQIYTNGLLIPGLKDEVLKEIFDNNISVSISEYRPTHKIIDKIISRLDDFEIRYHIAEYDDKQVFNVPISLSSDSKYPRMCISDGCITVSDGRIARCPTLMYVERFNEYFKKDLPTEGIYAINEYKSGEKLLEDMKKEVPLCRHCIKCDMEWSTCKKEKKIEDFAVYE